MSKIVNKVKQMVLRNNTNVQQVVKEEKGLATIAATLLILVLVILASYMAWNWYQNSQKSAQSQIDSNQNQLFNTANNVMAG